MSKITHTEDRMYIESTTLVDGVKRTLVTHLPAELGQQALIEQHIENIKREAVEEAKLAETIETNRDV